MADIPGAIGIDLALRLVPQDGGGFDFYLLDPHGDEHDAMLIASGIPTLADALRAFVGALTAPQVDAARLEACEQATAQISALIDTCALLEERVEALQHTVDETNRAIVSLMAGGATPVNPARTPTTSLRLNPADEDYLTKQRRLNAQQAAQDTPGRSEAGFAGTFRKPLTDSVHAGAGKFPGGPFRRGQGGTGGHE